MWGASAQGSVEPPLVSQQPSGNDGHVIGEPHPPLLVDLPTELWPRVLSFASFFDYGHLHLVCRSLCLKMNQKKAHVYNEYMTSVLEENVSASRLLQLVGNIRRLLCLVNNPPIDETIKSGCVPRLVQLLSCGIPEICFESAWALTNICSGSSQHVELVTSLGVIPIFTQLMSSADSNISEQCAWALGNIAGDSPHFRDCVNNHGALAPLIHAIENFPTLSLVRTATWLLSNMCRGKPRPDFDIVRHAIPTLSRLLFSGDDPVVGDACWSLCYLSDGPNAQIQAVIDGGSTRQLVTLMTHPSDAIVIPALRTVGNIVTGHDLQTQLMINLGVIPILLHLLSHVKKSIVKEAIWTLTNITAGTPQQIQTVIDADIFPVLIRILNAEGSEEDIPIQKEALWAISNAAAGGSAPQHLFLITIGCLTPMIKMLNYEDAKIICVALEGLQYLLASGDAAAYGLPNRENYVAILLEDHGGLDTIEELQSHADEQVYRIAVQILETYYDGKE